MRKNVRNLLEDFRNGKKMSENGPKNVKRSDFLELKCPVFQEN